MPHGYERPIDYAGPGPIWGRLVMLAAALVLVGLLLMIWTG